MKSNNSSISFSNITITMNQKDLLRLWCQLQAIPSIQQRFFSVWKKKRRDFVANERWCAGDRTGLVLGPGFSERGSHSPRFEKRSARWKRLRTRPLQGCVHVWILVGGNLMRRGPSDLAWTIVVRFVNRPAGRKAPSFALSFFFPRTLFLSRALGASTNPGRADDGIGCH